MVVRGPDCTDDEWTSVLLPESTCSKKYDRYKEACKARGDAEEDLATPIRDLSTRSAIKDHRDRLVRSLSRMRDCYAGRVEFRDRCVCAAYRDEPHENEIRRAKSTVDLLMARLDAIAAWYAANPEPELEPHPEIPDPTDDLARLSLSSKSRKKKTKTKTKTKSKQMDMSAFDAFLAETYGRMDANVEDAVRRVEEVVPKFQGNRMACLVVLAFLHVKLLGVPMRLSQDSYSVLYWDTFRQMLHRVDQRLIASCMRDGLAAELKSVPDRARDPDAYERAMADFLDDVRRYDNVLIEYPVDVLSNDNTKRAWVLDVDPRTETVRDIVARGLEAMNRDPECTVPVQLRNYVYTGAVSFDMDDDDPLLDLDRRLDRVPRSRSGNWHIGLIYSVRPTSSSTTRRR